MNHEDGFIVAPRLSVETVLKDNKSNEWTCHLRVEVAVSLMFDHTEAMRLIDVWKDQAWKLGPVKQAIVPSC